MQKYYRENPGVVRYFYCLKLYRMKGLSKKNIAHITIGPSIKHESICVKKNQNFVIELLPEWTITTTIDTRIPLKAHHIESFLQLNIPDHIGYELDALYYDYHVRGHFIEIAATPRSTIEPFLQKIEQDDGVARKLIPAASLYPKNHLFNLLPWRKKKNKRSLMCFLAANLILFMIVAFIAITMTIHLKQRTEATISHLQSTRIASTKINPSPRFSSIENEAKKLKIFMKKIEKNQTTIQHLLNIFNVLGKALTDHATLSHFALKDNKLSLSGTALQYPPITKLLKALEKLSFLSQIQLSNIDQRDGRLNFFLNGEAHVLS